MFEGAWHFVRRWSRKANPDLFPAPGPSPALVQMSGDGLVDFARRQRALRCHAVVAESLCVPTEMQFVEVEQISKKRDDHAGKIQTVGSFVNDCVAACGTEADGACSTDSD